MSVSNHQSVVGRACPGVALAAATGYENQLAFANPDGSTVIVAQNDLAEPLPVHFAVAGRVIAPVLPADSFSTLVVPPRVGTDR